VVGAPWPGPGVKRCERARRARPGPAPTGVYCARAQTVFCCDTYSRGFLDLPRASAVDFRASCFCHKVGPGRTSHRLARGHVCLCQGFALQPCAPALHQARGPCSAGPAGRNW